MKSLGDAIELRNRLIQLLEEADFECASGEREYLLSIVVAGGGFAGVETVAGVNDFLREALRFYPHLTEGHLRVMLVEPGPLLLPELGEKLGAYAQEKLAERKVEIRVKTGVQGITERGVELSDGTTIPAHTLVWTAGTSPNPLLASLPCRKERGRVCVDEFMQVPGYPGVWRLAIARPFPTERPASNIRQPRNTHCARERCWRKTSPPPFEAVKNVPLSFRRSGSWRRSDGARASRASSVSIFRGS